MTLVEVAALIGAFSPAAVAVISYLHLQNRVRWQLVFDRLDGTDRAHNKQEKRLKRLANELHRHLKASQ